MAIISTATKVLLLTIIVFVIVEDNIPLIGFFYRIIHRIPNRQVPKPGKETPHVFQYLSEMSCNFIVTLEVGETSRSFSKPDDVLNNFTSLFIM